MSQELLVAEDDPKLAAMLREYLERLGFLVRSTSSAHVARQWFQEAGGSGILDGSGLGHMGIPLRELPSTRVIIWSGDSPLAREAQQLSLRALCKGNPQGFRGLLQEVASRD